MCSDGGVLFILGLFILVLFILACTPVQFILTRLKENHSDKAQGESGTDECLG